jgi:AraC-like DNA-binding protein
VSHVDDTMQIVVAELTESQWKLSERDAAALIFRTVRCFRDRFRRTFGMSYREFRVRMKLTYGWELVRETTLPISAIAYRLGYASRRKFDLAFKKRFNETPADCRARFRELRQN